MEISRWPTSRVLTYGVLVTLTLVTLTQPGEGTHHCFQCLRGESSYFCNASSNLQRCDGNREMCFTTVINSGGQLYSTKGCILPDVCNIAAMANDALCSTGTVLRTCTYCCVGESCNYDRFTYSPTVPTTTALPPPTTTTIPSVRAVTISALSTVMPPSCNEMNLTACVSSYESALTVALKDPRKNFPFFCRQVPVMFQCIAEAISSCCQDNQVLLHEQLTSVAETMWTHCPRVCSPPKGQICTTNIVVKVITDFIDGEPGCKRLQTDLIEYRKCLVLHVGTCGDTRRVKFEKTAQVIGTAVKVICDIPPTASPTEEPTPAGCDEERAKECVTNLALNITSPDEPDYDYLCHDGVPDTEHCLQEATLSCPPATRERFERAFNFTLDLMPKDCPCVTEAPPVCDTTAARTCALEIWRVIDEKQDYGLACRMVPETVDCVLSNVTGCTEKEKVSLNRTLDVVLERLKGRCDKVIEVEDDCSSLELEEGGNEKTISLKTNFDPKILCGGEQDCQIYAELLIEEGDGPKCRNGKIIPQVVCRPEVPPTSRSACGVLLTSANWRQTHRIHLAATLDNKVDGVQRRKVNVVYRKYVGGKLESSTTAEVCHVTIIDHDTTGQCSSLNDPHLKTFDGNYYDNFYQGAFVLYRHTRLPYEVQVLYQSCGRIASCNCGVAVKSGDYVFFAEVCRRKNSFCTGRRKRHPSCFNLLKAKSFVYDIVTPGTRLFKRPSGFEVWLPHGTRVVIQYYKQIQLIDVWVKPSSADHGSTTGLCGVYDGSKRDDLLLPDGQVYMHAVSRRRMPKTFNRAWRVENEQDIIYKGVPRNPFRPAEYCQCQEAACGNVSCSAEHLVSTCDLDKTDEVSFTNVPLVDPDVIQGRRRKRQADEDDLFDFDISFEPAEIDTSALQWTEQEARRFCQSYFDTSDIVNLCRYQVEVEAQHFINICVQDILLTDNTSFAISSLEGLKADCTHTIETDSKFESGADEHVVVRVNNANCPMECNQNGACENGVCQCTSDYVGATCDVRKDALPRVYGGSNGGICETRRNRCAAITVFADDVINSEDLTCHLTSVEVIETGVINVTGIHVTKAVYVSSNQVVCQANADVTAGGYYVDLSNDGVNPSGNGFLYIMHDWVCHDCEITDDGGATCRRKGNSCLVGGKCYAPGESRQQDACSVCDPGHSESTLKSLKTMACLGTIVLVIIFIAVVIIIAIVMAATYCCCCRRKSKQKRLEEASYHELHRKKWMS